MQLSLRNNLPFIAVRVSHRGLTIKIADVLVDTGSARTVFSADAVARLNIAPEPGDRLRALRGVGGRELVFTRRLDQIEAAGYGLNAFEVEIAGMDYGFAINGILGVDFLVGTRARIDLGALTLEFS